MNFVNQKSIIKKLVNMKMNIVMQNFAGDEMIIKKK